MVEVPDEELRPAILTLIRSAAGAACDLGLLLRVCRLASGRYWVTSETPDGERLWANEYATAEEGVDMFLALRRERRLGMDYGPWPLE